MQQLYGNKMITNLESVPYIETCLKNLKGLMYFPLLVFQTSTDMYGVPLNKESDEILYRVCKVMFLVQWRKIA